MVKPYYYILTIQTYTPHGMIMTTCARRVELEEEGEFSFFIRVYNEMIEHNNLDQSNSYVIFWSLKPDVTLGES